MNNEFDTENDESIEIKDFVADLQVEREIGDAVLLQTCVRRGSPAHKLWQKLHLCKYPESY